MRPPEITLNNCKQDVVHEFTCLSNAMSNDSNWTPRSSDLYLCKTDQQGLGKQPADHHSEYSALTWMHGHRMPDGRALKVVILRIVGCMQMRGSWTSAPRPYTLYRSAIIYRLKGALYRIWCGVSRLDDSDVKVV